MGGCNSVWSRFLRLLNYITYEQALEHAKQAEKAKPDPHITEAETHLSQAIDSAATGQKDAAVKHAQEAINHLKLAYKGTGQ